VKLSFLVIGTLKVGLLMVQKSQTTTWDVQNPVNNGIFTLSTGAGFLPSTGSPCGSFAITFPSSKDLRCKTRYWKALSGGNPHPFSSPSFSVSASLMTGPCTIHHDDKEWLYAHDNDVDDAIDPHDANDANDTTVPLPLPH